MTNLMWPGLPVSLLKFRQRGLQFCRKRVTEGFLRADFREQLGFARLQEIRELGLEVLHFFHGDIVEDVVLHGPKNRSLDFHRNRVVLRLLEKLDDAFAALELGLRLGVEVGTELRE